VFIFYRLFRNASPRIRWLVGIALGAGGLALVVLGVLWHNPVLAVRGAVLLVGAGLVGWQIWRSPRFGGGRDSSRRLR